MSPVVKKRGERFTIPSKYLLFVLTCICVVVMALSLGTDIFNRPLNTVVGYIVVPFQQGISKMGGWIYDRTEELEQVRVLIEENVKLKKEIDELTIENTRLQQDKAELNRLRELYKMDNQYDEYTKVGARIIARDTGNWYSSFTIDKGEKDGLTVDMNVIADGGLVGRITAIGPNWATVSSIIANNSNVSSKTLSTSDLMMVSGDLESMKDGLIRFSQLVDSNNAVMQGDKVVTSHISDKFLPDILVGYVFSIQKDANNLTKSGYLSPAVDFEHLEEVLVIYETKELLEE